MSEWLDYSVSQGMGGGFRAAAGRLLVRDGVSSPQLANERRILVHLPDDYETGQRRYPVIYMHDGQNLFDPQTSYAGEWGVDDTLATLGEQGLAAIVVGIPNMGDRRLAEYSPFPDARLGGGEGEDYLDFIAETLKPLIDREFRTLPDRKQTGIVGSSMGGLISLYAFFHRPEVFGFAGVMSPSLWFARGAIFGYLEEAPFIPGRLHLCVGTREGSGMLTNAQMLRDLLRRRGYRLDYSLQYLEADADHHESAWGARLPTVLRFLLPRADAPRAFAAD
jgi:predicted alpha/beta superfamily hydrolase